MKGDRLARRGDLALTSQEGDKINIFRHEGTSLRTERCEEEKRDRPITGQVFPPQRDFFFPPSGILSGVLVGRVGSELAEM